MEKQVMMNKLDGVSGKLVERRKKSRELRDASLNKTGASKSGVKPMMLKSILKQPKSPSKEGIKVSMNPSTTVWEVDTDYASPSRVVGEDGVPFYLPNDSGRELNDDVHKKNDVCRKDVTGSASDLLKQKSQVGASNDANATNSLGNTLKDADGSKVPISFASVLKPSMKKVVQIKELRNEDHVEGAAVSIPLSAIEEVSARFSNTLYGYFVGKRLAFRLVENYVQNTWAKFGIKRIKCHGDFFLFQFDSKEGMDRVLESGPWLIRMVPLILNVWSPDSVLHKAEIKKVPVWVKLHQLPIIAYSEVGLSLITTQIGKPIRLDTYTSNMCLNSWGRSEYARALIEISVDEVLKEELVVAIPIGKDQGHALVTIKIEYEWRPPRCSTCLIFDHENEKCPKLPKEVPSAVINKGIMEAPKPSNDPADDGFEVVKKKRNKRKKHQKQVDGVVLSKPSLNLHYRRVDSSSKQVVSNVASTSMVGKAISTSAQHKTVRLENSFSALYGDDDSTTWKHTQQALNVTNESDSDVDEEINLDDRGGHLKTTSL